MTYQPSESVLEYDDEEYLDKVPARFRELTKKPKKEKIVNAEWRGDWY